ncbi:hypothetical protein SARC_00194 [Sphaeroforma arctica JP610]|uniref:Uncharacterized protein n=1 Tax=Sphaeroforma arctica JP610 TaxID=667725 RepID=A0A0L0GFS2_9EUKA|nr:hypothetical protein SARC_00194 [Sphaeroforma arctica JP610]KNC87686.1 hypothetical protein SARC_00194 [Sphaeroforma arctica JP610]|eukprot:XP_014161588.1 hypothetical protein SARC_00194 [Sphaeroforma arctica JP610]
MPERNYLKHALAGVAEADTLGDVLDVTSAIARKSYATPGLPSLGWETLTKLSSLHWVIAKCRSAALKKAAPNESRLMLLDANTSDYEVGQLNDSNATNAISEGVSLAVAITPSRFQAGIENSERTRLELELELVKLKLGNLQLQNTELKNEAALAQGYKQSHSEQNNKYLLFLLPSPNHARDKTERLNQAIERLLLKNSEVSETRIECQDLAGRLASLQALHEGTLTELCKARRRECHIREELKMSSATVNRLTSAIEIQACKLRKLADVQTENDRLIAAINESSALGKRFAQELETCKADAAQKEKVLQSNYDTLVGSKQESEVLLQKAEDRLKQKCLTINELGEELASIRVMSSKLELQIRHAIVHGETLQAESEDMKLRADTLELELQELRKFKAFIHNFSGGSYRNASAVNSIVDHSENQENCNPEMQRPKSKPGMNSSIVSQQTGIGDNNFQH